MDNGGGPSMTFTYNSTLVGGNVLLHLSIAVQDDAWVGVGIGKVMVPGNAIIGISPELQTITGYPGVAVYSMSGKDESQVTPMAQSLASFGISTASFAFTSGWSVLQVSMNLSAAPPFLQFCRPDVPGVVSLQLAQGQTGFTDVFYRHLYYGLVDVNMFPVGANDTSDTVGQPNSLRQSGQALALHVIFMSLAFALLFPLGAALGALRPGKYWLGAHVSVQFVAIVLVLAGVALGAQNRMGRQLPMLSSTHSVLGAAVGAGAAAQLFIGSFLYRIVSTQQVGRQRTMTLAGHRAMAGLVLLGGLGNMLLGTARFTLAMGLNQSSFNGAVINNSDLVTVVTAAAALSLAAIGLLIVAYAAKRWRARGGTKTVVLEPLPASLPAPSSKHDPPLKPFKPTEAFVLYNYASDNPKDLPVTKGQRVRITAKFEDGWWQVTNVDTGRCGLVPAAYVQE